MSLTKQHLFAGSTDRHCKIFHWGSRIFRSDSQPELPPSSPFEGCCFEKALVVRPGCLQVVFIFRHWAGVPGSDHAFLAEDDKPIEADELSLQELEPFQFRNT